MTGTSLALLNTDAERAVLGALLVEPLVLAKVRPILGSPKFFGSPSTSETYRAMLALSDRFEAIDHITLRTELRIPDMDPDAIELWLMGLLDDAVTTANAVHHSRIVLDGYRRRQLQVEGMRLAKVAGDPLLSVGDMTAQASAHLVDVMSDDPDLTPRSLSSIFLDTMESIEESVKRGDEVRWLPTGFDRLDRLTDGHGPGQLIVLAARPGEGKSSLALAMGQIGATEGPVHYVSLEMTETEQGERMIQSAIGRDIKDIRRSASLLDQLAGKISMAVGRLSKLPIVFDCASRSPGRLRLALQAQMIATGRAPSLVVVDYLQLMDADEPQQNRDREVGSISKALKRLAMELRVPILLLSQLNRGSVKENRPPVLHDLRDSGNIEQDANVVMMLHWPSEQPETGGNVVDLYVRKCRHGKLGKVPLVFEGWSQRWREVGRGLEAEAA